jgi:hypothetical protein
VPQGTRTTTAEIMATTRRAPADTEPVTEPAIGFPNLGDDPSPTQQLVAALTAFQSLAYSAPKDSKNPHFRSTYASLASVLAAIQPATQFGLSHTVTFGSTEQGTLLVTTLHHIGGASISSELLVPMGADWQKNGSAMTYARRYALMALYGLAPEDDDGNAAVAHPVATAQRAPEPAPRPSDPAKVLASVEAAIARSGLTQFGIRTVIHIAGNGNARSLREVPQDRLEQIPLKISRADRVALYNQGINPVGNVQVLVPEPSDLEDPEDQSLLSLAGAAA